MPPGTNELTLKMSSQYSHFISFHAVLLFTSKEKDNVVAKPVSHIRGIFKLSIKTPWWNQYANLLLNTLRQIQNGCHFPDIIKCIFLNENVWISIKIPLKFVPKGLINNIPALVQIMAWHRPGTKPLSESIIDYSAEAVLTYGLAWEKSMGARKT